jgi:(1->4)-alpha-D-glucan 1-alpha-D-glucosylmutase
MVPNTNDEYFLYQTLIGSFPFEGIENTDYVDRLKDYVIKAVREAKVYTAWLRPDNDYETGFMTFIDSVLEPSEQNQFLNKFIPFCQKVANYGIFNSLSQTLLKITAPGVPDIYQGTEFWDLSHVDPDNRRPVDFERRIEVLREIKEQGQTDILQLVEDLIATREDARIKLFLTARALEARKKYLQVFESGDYLPLEAVGTFKDNVVAFARSFEDTTVIVIAPRFFTGIVKPEEMPIGKQVWKDTNLKLSEQMPSVWKDAITNQAVESNGTLAIGEALTYFPAALLIGEK